MNDLNKTLSSIDLFSGIGGFSLSLKNVCTPKLFCDSNIYSRRVLESAFFRGDFIPVPIHDDIYTLRVKRYVEVICAGFPCQDVSIMNRGGEGIFGKRSSAVMEVLRIAKSIKASIILLENSPHIEHRGLEVLMTALKTNGYDRAEWGIFSASDQGAPHERKRFYMVAVRKGKSNNAILSNMNKLLKKAIINDNNYWKLHVSPARVIRKSERTENDKKHRGFLLGNSIVPQCARFACYELTSRLLKKTDFDDLLSKNKYQTNVTIRLDVPVNKIISPGGKREYVKSKWSTPLASRWSSTKIGSDRASRILPNQILYEKETRYYMKRHGKENVDDWVVNPEFVEWMMGYPRGWTRDWNVDRNVPIGKK